MLKYKSPSFILEPTLKKNLGAIISVLGGRAETGKPCSSLTIQPSFLTESRGSKKPWFLRKKKSEIDTGTRTHMHACRLTNIYTHVNTLMCIPSFLRHKTTKLGGNGREMLGGTHNPEARTLT